MNCEKEVTEICNWIKQITASSNKTGVVIGLSGGIDSAVSSSLCVKALGKENVFGMIMPCYSNPDDTKCAKELIEHLQIDHKVFMLGDLCSEFEAVVCGKREADKYHLGNAKARMRMMTLYYMSGVMNRLVCGTENKTEHWLGYATKYGDAGTDFEPIVDYYKFEVYELAKYLSVPESIINRPPSAGLWTGQTDEGEIGVTYKEIDNILINEPWKNTDDLSEAEKKIYSLVKNSEHKRNPVPHFIREC